MEPFVRLPCPRLSPLPSPPLARVVVSVVHGGLHVDAIIQISMCRSVSYLRVCVIVKSCIAVNVCLPRRTEPRPLYRRAGGRTGGRASVTFVVLYTSRLYTRNMFYHCVACLLFEGPNPSDGTYVSCDEHIVTLHGLFYISRKCC